MKYWKKILVVTLTLVVSMLTACGKEHQGTYYPDVNEMQENLEKEGYIVKISNNIYDEYTGTELTAQMEDEFIIFYWLDEPKAVDDFVHLIENSNVNYNKLVSIEDDEKIGNIVYCGTNKAIKDAGIIIVEVKVNVNTK